MKALSDELILPALVNAHAHLDLSPLGPTPYGGDFTAWLREVVRRRPSEPKRIIEAVREGLRLSRAAGVGHIGDIDDYRFERLLGGNRK